VLILLEKKKNREMISTTLFLNLSDGIAQSKKELGEEEGGVKGNSLPLLQQEEERKKRETLKILPESVLEGSLVRNGS